MTSTLSASAFSASSCSNARSISSASSPSNLARILPTRLFAAAPNYITDDATIEPKKVRRRVADSKEQTSELVYINLADQSQTTLGFNTLPGFDEDGPGLSHLT